MKGILGIMLLAVGLALLIGSFVKGFSILISIGSFILFGLGLELIIADRINKAKEEILEEINNTQH